MTPARLFLEHLAPPPEPPTLMTLATVGADGYPRTRTVMVSGVGDDGRVRFHTDSRSQKVRDVEGCPKASLTVLTPDRRRQVTVVGDVVADTAAGSREAFARRSRYLQLLAWLNDRGLAVSDVGERRRVWAEFDAAHPDLASDPPDTWAGFAVVPREYLFWTADDAGPSHRVRYTRTTGVGGVGGVGAGGAASETEVGESGGEDGWAREVLPG